MSTERPPESRDSVERPPVFQPVESAAAPIVDLPAQQSYIEMNDSRTRGTATALAEIDRGGALQIVDSLRRAGGDNPNLPTRRLRNEEGEPIRTIPHTVRPGQTLWSISAEHHSDSGNRATPQEIERGIGDILNANPGLDPRRPIRDGQRIQVPESIRTGFRSEGRPIAGAPTAMVLDTFDGSGSDRGVADISHGGFLSRAFNALGFNIVRGNVPEPRPMRHADLADFSGTMQRAANYIEANRDQFPPGSFLNTSFGNNVARDERGRPIRGTGDLTWSELSKMVGMQVNAGNIRQSTDEVLRRLGQISEGRNPVTGQPDSKITARDREIAGAAVRTNQQVERIQAMGVEVIHSAGNDGAGRIDINFLRATNLRADAPRGPQALKFSGVGDHTQHGAGVIPIYQLDRNTVAADVNGILVRMPIDKEVKFDRRDHRIDYDAIQRGEQRTLRLANRRNPEQFDVEAHTRGYDQRVYNIGNRVDSFTGTSFSPLSYVVRTRNIQRPPEP